MGAGKQHAVVVGRIHILVTMIAAGWIISAFLIWLKTPLVEVFLAADASFSRVADVWWAIGVLAQVLLTGGIITSTKHAEVIETLMYLTPIVFGYWLCMTLYMFLCILNATGVLLGG